MNIEPKNLDNRDEEGADWSIPVLDSKIPTSSKLSQKGAWKSFAVGAVTAHRDKEKNSNSG